MTWQTYVLELCAFISLCFALYASVLFPNAIKMRMFTFKDIYIFRTKDAK